jgi:hypothetical protein
MALQGDALKLFMVSAMCTADKRDAQIMRERSARPRGDFQITPFGFRALKAGDRQATHDVWMRAARVYLSHGKASSARAALHEARRALKAACA